MKIRLAVFVDGEFIPSHSGATNRFHYLSRYLQLTEKVDVTVFVCDRGWCDYSKISQEPFTTYLLRPEDYTNSEFVARLLKKENIDIVQFANLEGCVFQGLPLTKYSDFHLVLEAHYDEFAFSKNIDVPSDQLARIKDLQLKFGPSLDGIIALSLDEIEAIRTGLSFSRDSMVCIPSGVDTTEISVSVNRLTKRLVFLGNLYFEPNARAGDLVHTFLYSQLVGEGYTFLIAGDVPDEMRKKYEAKDFVFLGKVTDLNNLFKDASIALCPILDDSGMRIKILNYLAAGLPVITTTAGAKGFPDKGILMIEDDLNLYPEKIRDIIKNTHYYDDLSASSRMYAEKNLSWKVIADRCVDWYKKLLSEKAIKKDSFIDTASQYPAQEPAWIDEVVKKGRFKGMKSLIRNGHFMEIRNGQISSYNIATYE